MKVSELQDYLTKWALPDDEVVLAQDPEGNGFLRLFEVDTGTWWDGTEPDFHLGPEDEDAERCVVLWP